MDPRLAFVFMQREGLFQWKAGLAGLLKFLEGVSSVVPAGVVINLELLKKTNNNKPKKHYRPQKTQPPNSNYAIAWGERLAK